MTTSLPADTFMAAAFDELLTDTQNLLDATIAQKPYDKDEARYWRSQRTAYVNAQGDWLDGLRPIATDSGYILRSASQPGRTHRAWRLGGIWTCSCTAGDRGIFHRHTALISVIERASELESLALDGPILHLSIDPPLEDEPNPLGDTEGDPEEAPEWRGVALGARLCAARGASPICFV